MNKGKAIRISLEKRLKARGKGLNEVVVELHYDIILLCSVFLYT
jgi:hypothetical protein